MAEKAVKSVEDMQYEYWLAAVRPFPNRKKRNLREVFGSAKNIYYIEETNLRKTEILTEMEIKIIMDAVKTGRVGEQYDKYMEKGGRFIPYFDSSYPERLENISSPPYALYVKGSLPDDNKPSAAIVGARDCTPYGEQMAVQFGEALAGAGIQVISGMARGIDGAGQRGALNAGGSSYGVLGCGIDICYPRENKGLYMDLQRSGGILSEQPEGTAPLKEYFPARNRIISGLSDTVLVMEARKRSGSLITADMALEQGKEVYALPGPVTSRLSEGCNYLIRQGAGILLSAEDLLKELDVAGRIELVNEERNKVKNEKVLESAEKLVYSKLDLYPKSLSLLLEETEMGAAVLADSLISLELKGYAKEISKNYYIRAENIES